MRWREKYGLALLAVLVVYLLVAIAPLYVSDQRLRERLDWSLRGHIPIEIDIAGQYDFLGSTIEAQDAQLRPNGSEAVLITAARMSVDVDLRWLLAGRLRPLSARLFDAQIRIGSTAIGLENLTIEPGEAGSLHLDGILSVDAATRVTLQISPEGALTSPTPEAWLHDVGIRLQLDAVTARGEMHGTARLLPAPSLNLSLEVAGDGGPLPFVERADLPAASLSGELSLTPDHLAFFDAEFGLGSATGAGRVDVDFATMPPQVSGRFALGPIDLAPDAQSARPDLDATLAALTQLATALEPLGLDVAIASSGISASALGVQLTDAIFEVGQNLQIGSPGLMVGPLHFADAEIAVADVTVPDSEDIDTILRLSRLQADGVSSAGELVFASGTSGETTHLRLDGGDLNLAEILDLDSLARTAQHDRSRVSLAARPDRLTLFDRIVRGGRVIASDGPGAAILQLRDGEIDRGTLSFSLAADAADLRFSARAEEIPLAEVLGAPHLTGRAFLDIDAAAPRPGSWADWQGRAVWLAADTALPVSAPIGDDGADTLLAIDEIRGVLIARGVVPWQLENVSLRSEDNITEGSGTYDPTTGEISIQLYGEENRGESPAVATEIRISGRPASLFATHNSTDLSRSDGTSTAN